MLRIAINTRVLRAPGTGVQRYTMEMLSRWNGSTDSITPDSPLRGFTGHAWEQLVLPGRLQGRFLFSPSNSGPLRVRKQVVVIHDMSPFDCPEMFNSRFATWYQFLLPRLARRARMIITVSNFMKERIVTHTRISPEKIAVIPNGVASGFCPDAVSGLDAAASFLGLPSRNYILVVGSIEPRKNLARLFQAWAQVRARTPDDLWLIVAGSTGDAHVFGGVSFDKLPDRIFFTGRVDEALLPSLFAGAVGVAYVSTYEGFGLPALEAMASGTPLLAGNRSAIPEVVGNAGVLVDPFEVEQIADGIVTLIENTDLRAELRALGLRRARKFSWEESARRTWLLLQSVADS